MPDIVDEEGTEWFDDGTIFKAFGPTDQYYDKGKAICAACPVSQECLGFALKNRIKFGLYGGHTPLERRRIERRERRRRLQEKRNIEDVWDDVEDNDE